MSNKDVITYINNDNIIIVNDNINVYDNINPNYMYDDIYGDYNIIMHNLINPINNYISMNINNYYNSNFNIINDAIDELSINQYISIMDYLNSFS